MLATRTFRMSKRKGHVAIARRRVRETLASWGAPAEKADAVTLLANELVTNAVTHCHVSQAVIEVTLALKGAELTVEVSDPDRDRLPRLHAAGPDAEGGRGLALVAELADAWGHRQGPYTKCVWARFTLTGQPRRADVPAGL
ncbi:ATP-binding protein [Streptomyces sp. NPDC007084]|uniref:ATP-binding protein n=1 Tax=Streptomyces sp. NPDC007084 TaxID=3154313 RepID=UPI00345472A2